MQGYLITFYTQQDREHEGRPLAQWILDQARKLGVRGATLLTAKAGFGHDGRFHSESFFDLSDNPTLIQMALTPEESDKLFACLADQKIRIFYTKYETEFGFIGQS